MLLWLGLFVLASMCSAANISASIETDGSYVIAVNGVAWLNRFGRCIYFNGNNCCSHCEFERCVLGVHTTDTI
jgi:hypothetical protein